MPVLTEIRNKLMGPLKNALLGATLSINPMILEKSAEKEIEKATEQIINQIAELGEDEINDILNNIGPETQEVRPPSTPANEEAPNTETSPQNTKPTAPTETPNDFPKDPKNDILDEENQNPEREQPQNPTDPKPGEENNDPKKDTPRGNSTETSGENPKAEESQKKPSPEELQKLQEEEEAQKEDEEDKKIEANKKGSITQSLNTNILQRGKIKQLEAKIKKEETAKKRMKRQILMIDATLAALHSAKLGLKALKLPADIIEFFLNLFIWSLGCCCLFIALVPPAKMYDFSLSIYIDLLEAQIKKISDKISQEQKRKAQLEKKIKELDTLMRQTQREIRKLQNKSVIEGIMGDKNNPYLQK